MRVLIMRRRQTFEKRGRLRLGLSITLGRPMQGYWVDAMQGAMWVESTAIKNAITRVPSGFRVYAMGILQRGCRRIEQVQNF